MTELDEEELVQWMKQTELNFGRTQAKRLLGIIPIDFDLLEYDGEKRHLLDWQRPYVTELLKDIL
jgi:2-amino-4-hydroxy-6-hydroxymethyldihydropteridine diphosphokinase